MAKVALLVGVSEYEPGLHSLPGSVKDVDAMQRVLAHPELGGFAETDITVLKNPQRQAMEDAIYSLFSDRKKDDLLLFYFSGHGIKDENGRLYLATRATRKDSNGRLVPPSAVAAASLHENINASKSQRQVMILDCCFSGAIAQGMTVKDDGTVNLKDYLGGKGRAILTSSTSTEYSFGSATLGHEDAGLSIYTRYLVEGIEKGAADTAGDGWIAVEELHEYAANRVKEAAPAMTPKFYPVEEGYKIVLARSRKDDPKLKYRKEAQARAEQGQGQFSIIAQRLLGGKRIEWGISAEEAKAIEDDVLQPYREYELKQQEYEQALAEEVVQSGYPLSVMAEAELKEYQQQLGLRDADIAAIEARILAPLKAQVTQQSATYQQNLIQYEQALTDAIQREFPLSKQDCQTLENLQQFTGLKNEDINSVRQPLFQQASLRCEEKLREEAERQPQDQEKAEQLEVEKRRTQEVIKPFSTDFLLFKTLVDAQGTIFSVSISSDGKYIAAGSGVQYSWGIVKDNTARIWETSSGRLIHSFTEYSGHVNCVTFSPDGRVLATGSEDKTIKFWNVETGEKLSTISEGIGKVSSIAFSPDGQTLAIGNLNNAVKLLNVAVGETLKTLLEERKTILIALITPVQFSPDGQSLASISLPPLNDSCIVVWNLKTQQKPREFRFRTTLPEFCDMAFHPNSRLLAVPDEKIIRLWNIETGYELDSFSEHVNTACAVAFSPNGQILASGDMGGSIKLWDATTMCELSTLNGHTGRIYSITFSSDNQFIVSGSEDKTVKIWQMQRS